MIFRDWLKGLEYTLLQGNVDVETEDVIYDSDGRTYRGDSSTEESSNIHVWSLDSWWKRLLLILVVVAVIVVIFAVISGIVSLIAPVLIPLLVIILLVRMLRRRW